MPYFDQFEYTGNASIAIFIRRLGALVFTRLAAADIDGRSKGLDLGGKGLLKNGETLSDVKRN